MRGKASEASENSPLLFFFILDQSKMIRGVVILDQSKMIRGVVILDRSKMKTS